MKSYIQGLITGGVFAFAFIVLMGQTRLKPSSGTNVGRYHLDTLPSTDVLILFDSSTGITYKIESAEWVPYITK